LKIPQLNESRRNCQPQNIQPKHKLTKKALSGYLEVGNIP